MGERESAGILGRKDGWGKSAFGVWGDLVLEQRIHEKYNEQHYKSCYLNRRGKEEKCM